MQNRISFTESNAYDFIEKIIYLEKTLGKNANYKTLEISELSSYKNDYNKIAKHIADFVGCKGSFIVTVEKDIESAGNIQDDGTFSFISLSRDIAKNFEASIAVIAHEIMHRLLKNNCLKYSMEVENEVLTDIATVYMGLGKLSLNGAFLVDKESGDDHSVITHIYHIGYIDEECFCFLFLIINKMRNIDISYYDINMSSEIATTLKNVSESAIYNNMLYYILDDEFSNDLKKRTISILNKFEDSSEKLTSLEHKLQMLNAEKLQIETTIEKINKQIIKLDSNNEYNHVLRKFQTIYDAKKVEDKIELIKSATDKFSNDIKIITENKKQNSNTFFKRFFKFKK